MQWGSLSLLQIRQWPTGVKPPAQSLKVNKVPIGGEGCNGGTWPGGGAQEKAVTQPRKAKQTVQMEMTDAYLGWVSLE